MRQRRGGDETATAEVVPYTEKRQVDFWRVLRLVCGLQGTYYLITGFWLLLDRFVAVPGPFSVLQLDNRSFGTDLIAALTALIGLVMVVSSSRARPDGLFTGLGFGTALAFIVVGWHYRSGFSNWLYLELFVEVLFALALFLTFWTAVIADRRRR
jgi:hypothetical protein